MKPQPSPCTTLASFLLLWSVGLAGCFGLVDDRCIPTKCDLGHILILHDITYEWDEEKHELSGHFILSNIHPDPSDTDKEVWLKILLISGRFIVSGVGRDHWQLGYDDYQRVIIKPGESMVFNYTFPKQVTYKNNGIDWTPDAIKLDMQGRYVYKDPANIREDNPEGFVDMNHDFQNSCLKIVDMEIIQEDAGDCSPWRDYGERHPGWYYKVGDYYFPPPEVWPTWNDNSPFPPLSEYPQFRRHVEFLQDFDFESANIIYFEGEID